MESWKIEFSKRAFKYYNKLDKNMKKRIDKILFWLSCKETFYLKPVEGEDDVYRIRIGKYRILLKILKTERTIIIVDIGARGDIYK